MDYTTYSYVYSFDGEAELPAEFQTQIEKENMELESFSLLNTQTRRGTS